MSAKASAARDGAANFRSAGLSGKNAADGRPLNAMTVDVEDYFHVQAFADVIQREDWDSLPTRVESNTSRMLDLFAEKRVTATFFVLGWVAERFPALVRRLAENGHEVASHSYGHQRIFTQTRDEFRADVRRAKGLIEDAAGKKVRGYRAPTFSLNADTWWAYDVLGEEGYSYSSSIYPVARDNYGMPNAPRTPFVPSESAPMVEIPMSTVRYGQRNFPASGGGFFRLLPYGVSRHALKRVNRSEGASIFYCHPWEIDPEQPRIKNLSASQKFRHYRNLDQTEKRLRRLVDDFEFTTVREVLQI